MSDSVINYQNPYSKYSLFQDTLTGTFESLNKDKDTAGYYISFAEKRIKNCSFQYVSHNFFLVI